MLILMICCLLVSGGIYFGLSKLGDYLVWKNYVNISEDEVRERNRGYMEDLQKFVNINRLSVSEAQETNRWTSGQHLRLVFYRDRDLIYYEQDTVSGDKNFQSYLSEEDRKSYEETLRSILDGNSDAYPISFTDGTLLVTFVDNTQSFMESVVWFASLSVAAIFFIVFMFIYFNNITWRIRRLANNVKAVEDGNMDMKIYDGGNDEIGRLAQDVNSMRNAVIDNMSKEREAWEANAGLITAMSHDIRTPLTVMMGYMELMEIQNEDPAFAEYIESCKKNAEKLKKLSDDMFSYFLVFGKRDFEQNKTVESADGVIRHMLEEHCILLSETGYNVSTCWNCNGIKVLIDQKYFGRVIDNVFSNIGKYAHKDFPICICVSEKDGKFVIRTENTEKDDVSDAESNRIGNKTCLKIMEQLDGEFISGAVGNKYVNEIVLPIYTKKKG